MSFSEHRLLLKYQFSDKTPLLVDVGAHRGTLSLAYARQGWNVLAFEPEHGNQALFQKSLSKYNHVTLIPKAVSDSIGDKIPFYVSQEHSGIHSLKPFHPTHKAEYEVETTTLNSALAEQELQKITLLKIDTEGADFLVLKGLDLERYRPELIMIEFMDERSVEFFGYTHHDVARYMADFGYTTYISEWAPLAEYAKKGEGNSQTWIGYDKYPMDHEPAWGNLFFVPSGLTGRFESTIEAYCKNLRWQSLGDVFRANAIAVPGLQRAYHWFRRY